MRNVTTILMASALILTSIASQAAKNDSVTCYQDDGLMKRKTTQTQMFDGISLTEHQRQQMRDLMRRAKRNSAVVNTDDMEMMYRLVIAENFDESAVKAQAEKLAQYEVNRQVEMAKISNRMYHLLTSEQQDILKTKHQQRMSQLCGLPLYQQGTPLMNVSQ